MHKSKLKASSLRIELTVPYIGKIEGIWLPDEKEQLAAWEMYVELVTRVTISNVRSNDGLLRETLTSLHAIFTITRDILRKYGPDVARPDGNTQITFGYLAVVILNFVLRPILSKWHPLLQDYENKRPDGVSYFNHEQNWEYNNELRDTLSGSQMILREYAGILAKVANIPDLINI